MSEPVLLGLSDCGMSYLQRFRQ